MRRFKNGDRIRLEKQQGVTEIVDCACAKMDRGDLADVDQKPTTATQTRHGYEADIDWAHTQSYCMAGTAPDLTWPRTLQDVETCTRDHCP